MTRNAVLMLGISLATIVAGCSDDGASPGPGFTVPKTGSSYMYENYMTDSTGAEIPGSRMTSTMTVAETGMNYMGRDNVHRMVASTGETTYLRYENNGDVSLYGSLSSLAGNMADQIPISYDPGWITFPVASGTPGTLPPIDTSITLPYNGLPITAVVKGNGTVTSIGSEEVTVGSEKLTAQRAVVRMNINASVFLLLSLNVTLTDTLWYSPKIGLITGEKGSMTTVPALMPGLNGGNGRTLTSYTLK